MWLGEKHKEALATLRYGILDNKGFLLLTGDVGTGKTTLINTLIGSLDKDVVYASVPDPSLERLDFFNYIGASFGIGREFDSKGKFLASFSQFLNKAFENNKKVLLIIDEAQLLTQELLEEIRLLSNIVTKDSNPLLNIFLVGQYEFNTLIVRPENRAIAQRITLNYYIEPLTLAETGEYIRHRLKVAGTTEKIFNPSAIKEIYAFSKGFPRKINIICDHSLMSGYAEEKKTITSSIVKDSAKDLQIPEDIRTGVNREAAPTLTPAGSSISVSSKQPKYPSNQIREQAQPLQRGNAIKEPFLWTVSGLLFIVGGSILVSLLFLYFTNTTYKEATTYLNLIQERIGLSSFESPEENINIEPSGKTDMIESSTQVSVPVEDRSKLANNYDSALSTQQTKAADVEVSGKVEGVTNSLQPKVAASQYGMPEVTILASDEDAEEGTTETFTVEQINIQPLDYRSALV